MLPIEIETYKNLNEHNSCIKGLLKNRVGVYSGGRGYFDFDFTWINIFFKVSRLLSVKLTFLFSYLRIYLEQFDMLNAYCEVKNITRT